MQGYIQGVQCRDIYRGAGQGYIQGSSAGIYIGVQCRDIYRGVVQGYIQG